MVEAHLSEQGTFTNSYTIFQLVLIYAEKEEPNLNAEEKSQSAEDNNTPPKKCSCETDDNFTLICRYIIYWPKESVEDIHEPKCIAVLINQPKTGAFSFGTY